jgi:LysR family transcriptional regulator (chromosome initiation inhibitor)
MAAPPFAERWFADGGTPRELAVAPMICFDRVDTMQDGYLRRRARQRLDPPRHYVPSSNEMLDAVVRGFGWGMLPDLQSAGLVAAGRLTDLDPRGVVDVTLYWQQWRLNSPALDMVSGAIHRFARERLH